LSHIHKDLPCLLFYNPSLYLENPELFIFFIYRECALINLEMPYRYAIDRHNALADVKKYLNLPADDYIEDNQECIKNLVEEQRLADEYACKALLQQNNVAPVLHWFNNCMELYEAELETHKEKTEDAQIFFSRAKLALKELSKSGKVMNDFNPNNPLITQYNTYVNKYARRKNKNSKPAKVSK
jgi:hypothetical protein